MKNIKYLKIKSKYFEETNEIWIPYDLYTSKVHENIDLFINNQTFINRYMQKIENNIDIIKKTTLLRQQEHYVRCKMDEDPI